MTDSGNQLDGMPGPCCACERTGEPLRNLLMLPYKAPVAGTGWGCVVCHLPADGAVAAICDACLEVGAPVVAVCDGYPASGGRVDFSSSLEPFAHVNAAHARQEGEAQMEAEDMWGEEWAGDGEAEMFVCAVCGCTAPRPPIVVFAGEGESMTATELCRACLGASL